MNSQFKILCSLMNDKLTSFPSKKQLTKNRLAFKKNARTSDHLTLKTVANKYVSDKKGKKLYTCFIDFKKAFDSVSHKGLFYKLESKGIKGNFLRLLQNIYSTTKCSLKINKRMTNYFDYVKGVLQGNPLSPLLFNLCINDIYHNINTLNISHLGQ